jgi:ribonuclease BN (tRNA processing enzyme)
VPFASLHAEMAFERIAPGESFSIGGFGIRSCQLNHPGVTLGYRIERDGAAVVIFTDTARIRAVQQGAGMKERARREGLAAFQARFEQELLDMVSGADLLVHDSHFQEEEIKGKEHWGHSTALDALALARQGGVRRLMLFHHAPEHSDDVVDRKLELPRRAAEDSEVEVLAAREGMAVDVPGRTEVAARLEATGRSS